MISALQLRQESDATPLDSLTKLLRGQNVLIVLDNCEHVIDAVAKMADAIGRTCPRVVLVVTSREPLGVDGERVYRVRSLSLPDETAEDASDMEGSDAVELFVARARAHDSTFELDDTVAPLVASVCRRLDGIPLAIELAASRLSSMSLDDLHERLDQRFRLLTGGSRNALPRQQTLGAMVAWSYDLLNEPERDLLRRLSVFVGGFDLRAAEAVCAGGGFESFDVTDLLSSLVNKSLVTAERASTSLRYRLLETIRQYAAEQLIQIGGESETVRVRQLHAEHYLNLCREAASELEGAKQSTWLRRLDFEYDNILATFTTLGTDHERTSDVLDLATGLLRFVVTRRNGVIPLHLAEALSRDVIVDVALRARALLTLAEFTRMNGIGEKWHQRAHDLIQEAFVLAQQLSDPDFMAQVLIAQSFTWSDLARHDLGLESGAAALEIARRINSPRRIADALATVPYSSQSPSKVHHEILESLAIYRQLEDAYSISWMLTFLALSLAETGGLLEAQAHNAEARDLAEQLGSTIHRLILWSNASFFAFFLGDLDQAVEWGRRALHLSRRSGTSIEVDYWTLFTLACSATLQGDYLTGAQLTGAQDGIEERATEPIMGYWSAPEIEARENNRVHLREALGDDEYERVIAAGKALSHDRVFELAMGRGQPVP